VEEWPSKKAWRRMLVLKVGEHVMAAMAGEEDAALFA
jgi:hypothetical protein